MKLHRIVLVLTALVVTAAAYAASWRINPSPYAKAQFATVKEAMDDINVRPGDTLMLDPGYHGSISVTRENMTVIGPGYFLDQNKGWGESQAAICSNVNLTKGCKIEGVVATKIEMATDAIVSRCKVNNIFHNYQPNFTVEQCYVVQEMAVRGACIVKNNIVLGRIYGYDWASGTVIENNVVIASSKSSSSGLIANFQNATIRNNIVINTQSGFDSNQKPYAATTLEFNTEYNNSINNNVLSTPADYADSHYKSNYFVGATVDGTFVNDGSDDGRYMLAPNSPAKGAASHGGDCGAFGGAQPYVLSGIPRFLPHITDVMVPAKPTDGKIVVKLKIANQDE